MKPLDNKNRHQENVGNWNVIRPALDCEAQECPILLRKSIEELFSGCSDVTMSHLTIITLSQKADLKSMKWHKEVETEKLAKYVSCIIYFFLICYLNIYHKFKYIHSEERYIYTLLVH